LIQSVIIIRDVLVDVITTDCSVQRWKANNCRVEVWVEYGIVALLQ